MMQLINLSYTDANWELSDLQLGETNLIVGKNATGKTRTLQTIDLLAKLINQKRNLDRGGKWHIVFKNNQNQILKYDFIISSNKQKEGVISENMFIDNVQVIKRNRSGASIKNLLHEGEFEHIFPPADKLILHTNRDIKKYPFLENIVEWAEQSFGFKFGNISPYLRFNQQEYDLLTAVEDIPSLFKSLKKENIQTIIKDFNSIGYAVSNISVYERAEGAIIYIKEDNLKNIPYYKLSQGMFRTLAIIIYLEYLANQKNAATIVIDDLCEGLDYDRATKLGKFVFQKCKSNGIQLVATSNDNFLIDAVDIEALNVLSRTNKTVTSINYHHNPHLFKEFLFTGLSNFDFFSSDYLLKTQNLKTNND